MRCTGALLAAGADASLADAEGRLPADLAAPQVGDRGLLAHTSPPGRQRRVCCHVTGLAVDSQTAAGLQARPDGYFGSQGARLLLAPGGVEHQAVRLSAYIATRSLLLPDPRRM